jgi:hypothetical protein
MKDIIYNLILASIGLFIVYVIFSNYLGTDNEGFEVDTENDTTTYDPDDAMTEADTINAEKEDAQEDKTNPLATTQLETAQAAADAATTASVGGEGNLPSGDGLSGPSPGADELFQNMDNDDNSSQNSDNSNNTSQKQPIGVLQKIYYMIFGSQEGFEVKSHAWLRNNHRAFTRFRAGRRRGRGWRRWRRRRKKKAHNWRIFVARRNTYWQQWRDWHVWNRARNKAAREKEANRLAQVRAKAAPYIKLWNKTNEERNQINHVLTHHSRHSIPHTVSGNKLRRRIGNHTWREYAKKLKLDGHHPWNRNHWRWRGGAYLNSIKYWLKRKRVQPGKAHHRWEAPGNAKKHAVDWVNYEIWAKKKAEEEAKKSNQRKANWKNVETSGTKFLGQFQDNKKMSKADEVLLRQKYGIATPIKDWNKDNIDKAHDFITERYNKVQDDRANALQAKAALAFQQKQAAQDAAKDAANASAALVAGEKAAAAEAAKAAVEAAKANAAAIRAMSNTFSTHVQKGRDNIAAINSRVTPMSEMNKNTIAQANSTKGTIDDLLTLQGGRIAKVNAVPMDAIKKISLIARTNYDKSISNNAQEG